MIDLTKGPKLDGPEKTKCEVKDCRNNFAGTCDLCKCHEPELKPEVPIRLPKIGANCEITKCNNGASLRVRLCRHCHSIALKKEC